MFIGHWSAAFAARAASDRSPKLGTLFVAAQLVDWAFFIFVLLGIEHMRFVPGITAMNPMDLYDMRFTHSLIGSCIFAGAFGAIVWVFTRDRFAALIAAMVVLSHWLLDLLVHRPDLTIDGAPPMFGFGLWNYPWIEMPLELGLTYGAMWWNARRTDGPPLPLVILGLVMLAMQAFNWFGPPPEAGAAVAPMAVLGLVGYAVATALAWWVGTTRRHR
ncbi:hypothetical protein [Tsuneonella mangrovi]|uniref:hypothetical protein n=1 Tax=Tsuneonella mangrovi TaxID=1982042 RepID=UPI000BA22148|nr:hypothetical protein [Tsuneonella mangrovi]